MKIYIKSDSHNGYLYIFKHGLGPGTIPKDVAIVKEKDLPNGYTAVWLDRFLRTDELKAYDIPSETEINRYLDRIGYCQKNGDVVPCDSVKACDDIMALTKPHPRIPEGWERIPEGDDDDGNWGTIAKALPNNQGYYWINIIEDEQGRRCFELEVGYRGDDDAIGKIWKAASKPFYRLGDIVKYADTKWRQLQAEYDEDVEACGDIKASTRIHANSDCYLDTQTGDSYTYDDLKEYWYSFKDWDYSLADFTSFEDWFNTSIENGIFIPCDEVEACGDIKASTSSRDIELLAREALNCNTKEELSQVIGSLLSIDKKLYLHYMELLRDDSVSISYIASQLSDELMNYDKVEGCGDIKASKDTEYFATMVNCSKDELDDELDDEFLIEGFYDNQRRGLAESAETSDVSALNELANEYANKGYYIVVHNLTDGTITEFSADNWFDDVARDGGVTLFMSW